MIDAELIALAALVMAETAEMQSANSFRCRDGLPPMYDCIWDTDACMCLNKELRRRGVLKTTGV